MLNARVPGESLDDRLHHADAPLRCVAGGGHRHRRDQHTRGIVAAVRVEQAHEATAEQRRADEQDTRDRDLPRNDEQTRPRDGGTAAHTDWRDAVLGERGHEIQSPHAEGRRQAERHAGEHGDGHREQNDGRIDAEVGGARKVGRQNRRQAALQDPGEREPRRAAEHAEDQAFHQELPQHARAGGAERRADRQLASSGGRARQLQARDVGGRDEQQQDDGREQHDQRTANVGGDRVAQRPCRHFHGAGAAKDGHRGHPGVGREPATRRTFGGRLRRRDAGTQLGDRLEQ